MSHCACSIPSGTNGCSMGGQPGWSVGPPQVGRINGNRGEFYGDDVLGGRPIRVVYIWSEITPTSARWEQAFSPDTGETWETNWIMESTRID